MKTNKTLVVIGFIILSNMIIGQIKVFSGGKTTIGSTSNPGTIGVAHWIVGNKMAITATTSSVTSAPMIIGQNAVSSIASYTWYNDEGTGFSHPAAQTMGFNINGNERARFTSGGNFLLGGTSDYGPRSIAYGSNNQQVFVTWANHSSNYGYAQISNVNNTTTKALAVVYNGSERFNVNGYGTVWCYGTYTGSDRNLKENIDSIPDALNKVLKLQGVTYNYKVERLHPNAMAGTILPRISPKKQIGLIAQEVELIVPEVVETREDGIKGVAYQNLVGLLIEAIKEQNSKVEDQDQKITQLQNDLSNCCTSKTSTGANNRSTNSIDNQPTNNESSWLAQNKPNPFNKETVIEYNIVQEGKGSILIFDMNGKLLKTIPVKIPGKGSVSITANDLPAGMYYYSLVVNDNEVDTKKMILTQ